ncbi:MAG: substrate-binding domain-containing protein, partial [Planctomycetota bacterium]
LIEAQRLGIQIPGDISILGFDDNDMRNSVYPKMTAVCQDAVRLGYEAFTGLSQLVTSERNNKPVVREAFPTWLEVNDTTGKPSTRGVRILPDGTRLRDE